MPLGRAQSLFTGKGKVGAIQVMLAEDATEDTVVAKLNSQLPEGVRRRRPAARTEQADQNMLASEQGLKLASILSVVLAAFIILNAFFMNVSNAAASWL